MLPTGTVTFALGETSKVVTIAVAGDAAVESDDRVIVTLAGPSTGASIGQASAASVILNDD